MEAVFELIYRVKIVQNTNIFNVVHLSSEFRIISLLIATLRAAPDPICQFHSHLVYTTVSHSSQGRTRHLVTTIRNVTRDMDQVTCYADNGYGTPMQSTRHVVISREWTLKPSSYWDKWAPTILVATCYISRRKSLSRTYQDFPSSSSSLPR